MPEFTGEFPVVGLRMFPFLPLYIRMHILERSFLFFVFVCWVVLELVGVDWFLFSKFPFRVVRLVNLSDFGEDPKKDL